MATPYLIADSAQVTVLRSLASTAFGKYSLALPEGVDLEDVYEVAAPGNEMAYVSSLGSKQRVGGMFRRFVRADVDVTAQGEDMVPASDVERVLDDAAKRVSGDFFLESDISKAGLGPWVPMVDFTVGDIANVEIWGRVVPLAVTRIEPKSSEHSDNDWSVHVGGQLLSDSEARLAENTDIYNAVVSDRRELAGLDGKIRAETSNRKAAVSAESDARRADVESVRGVLTGGGGAQADLVASLAGLNRQLQGGGEEPAPGLIPAYLQMNTRLWQMQEETNRALRRSDEALQAGQEANAELIRMALQLAEANKKVLALLHLKNHGAWSLSGNYTITKSWRPLSFGRARGTSEGCTLRSFPSFGTYVTLNEGGEWHISVRLYIPGQKLGPLSGDNTELRIIHMRNGAVVDRSTAMGYDKGWPYTLHVDTVFNVRAGDYVYADCASDSDHGDGPLSQSNSSNEYSEFMVRQLSRG